MHFACFLVGWALVVLGAASGIALFVSAVTSQDQKALETRRSTLWGLFLIGIAAGLLLLGVAEKAR